MNSATFDEFGRMTANLGLEAVPATPGAAEHHPLSVRQPADRDHRRDQPAERRRQRHADRRRRPTAPRSGRSRTTAWTPTRSTSTSSTCRCSTGSPGTTSSSRPTPTELGWKDTVRVSPLEDTIVALRPIVPDAAVRGPEQHPAAEPDDAARRDSTRRASTTSTRTATRSTPITNAARQLRLGVRLPLPHPQP